MACGKPPATQGVRFFDGPHQRAIVERRKHQPIDTLRNKAFDYLNLLFAIIFAQRALPYDFDLGPLRRQFARRFDCPGMNALPEFMRRAFRDDRDGQLFAASLLGTGLPAG